MKTKTSENILTANGTSFMTIRFKASMNIITNGRLSMIILKHENKIVVIHEQTYSRFSLTNISPLGFAVEKNRKCEFLVDYDIYLAGH